MLELQDETGSDDYIDSNSEDRITSESSSEVIEPWKIIQLANDQVSLAHILNSYEIKLEQAGGSKGWDLKGICPFKAHKSGNERTPSFWVNSSKGRFHCFGCQKSGQTVEFIAYYKDCNKLDIAKDILADTGISEFEAKLIDNSNEICNEKLIEFSNYVRIKIDIDRNNKLYIKNIDNILYFLDMYIIKTIEKKKLNPDKLQKILDNLKERI